MLSKTFSSLIKPSRPWAFAVLPNTNLNSKNLADARVKVYASIFPKISTLLYGLEIAYMRVFKVQQLEFEHKIALEMSEKLR